MNRVFKYEVPVDDQWHEFPELNGDVIHIDAQTPYVVRFWAINYDEGSPALLGRPDGPRRFRVYGTGQPLPECPHLVHGSAVVGALVWHLVEDATYLLPGPE
jgi:hypothetical protein